jgi:hypothetical protein
MSDDRALLAFMRAIGAGHGSAALQQLAADPVLAQSSLVDGATRTATEDFFFADHGSYVYAGDTALHVAAFGYDCEIARALVAAGADVMARNRRRAEPIHAAVNGSPGSSTWDPSRQVAMIEYLISAGADPNATAVGDVTPLHRAVRNRCADAVRVLLDAGAEPNRPNAKGSTPLALAQTTSGRSGSGSWEARAEQARIVDLLVAATNA